MLNTIGRIQKAEQLTYHLCLLGMLNTIGRILDDNIVEDLDRFARYVKYNR